MEYLVQEETLSAIADKIREKAGIEGEITPEAMPQGVEDAHATGVADGKKEIIDLTNTATAVASDVLSGKTFYKNGNFVTGTIATKTSANLTASGATISVPAGYYASNASKSVTTATRAETTMSTTADDTNDKLTITASNNQGTGYVTGANKTASKTVTLTASGATVTASDGSKSVSKSVATATQATPTVSINSSGLITASATQTAGYVSAGTKSGTKQLTTQSAKTVTPSTSEQTAVASGVYTTGAIKVGPIPSNYIDTSDATADSYPITAGATTLGYGSVDILSGKTAYVDGVKVEGKMTNHGAVTKTLNTTTKSYTIPSGYHNGSGKVSITTETKSATPRATFQTITPTSGKVLSSVTVVGDANLKAENIAEGVSIFGIAGTHSGGVSLTTKTVDFSVYRGSVYYCVYTTLDANGNITTAYRSLSGTSGSISNCVVGTSFVLGYNAMELEYVDNTAEVYSEDQALYIGKVT